MSAHECIFTTPLNVTGQSGVYTLAIERLGADVADTYANAVMLIGVELLYVGAGPSSAGYGPYQETVVIDPANP
jgi:hypothetical protein